MPVFSPKFSGVWTQTAQTEHDREESLVKHNNVTRGYLIRTITNKRTTKKYQKKSDADTANVNGDKLAIEDLNKPLQGKMWNERLMSVDVVYDLETGTAVCTKVLVKDEEKWTKKSDLPINTMEARIT